jgi:hypothetical protein
LPKENDIEQPEYSDNMRKIDRLELQLIEDLGCGETIWLSKGPGTMATPRETLWEMDPHTKAKH